MAKTTIEWTEANWNPFYGCRRKSPGCENCYAEQIAGRFSGTDKNGRIQPYAGIATREKGISRWTGEVKLNEDVLLEPLKIKKPTTFFVNSMSDTFYEKFPDEWIDKLFAVMALCPQHTFQILTKRADRMRDYFTLKVGLETREETIMREAQFIGGIIWDSRGNNKHLYQNSNGVENRRVWQGFPLPQVWLGVSVENQKAADERIPLLLGTPAAIRFLSCEPLLEKVDLSKWFPHEFISEKGQDYATARYGAWDKSEGDEPPCRICGVMSNGLHHPYATGWLNWVILGGESGPGARPCDISWIRSIVEQCRAAAVPCFVKQLGSKPTINYYDDLREEYFANDEDWTPLNWDEDDGQPPLDTIVRFPKKDRKGGDITEFPEDLRVREMPKI